MKIAVMSDLHLEFYQTMDALKIFRKVETTKADILVVAGDIHSKKIMRDYFLEQCNEVIPTVHVLGNHDYYAAEWYDDFFENEHMVGGCLWSNFWNETNENAEKKAPLYINDFRLIKDWSVDRMKELCYNHKDKIFKSDKQIVVTHFPPTDEVCAPHFRGDELNAYFMNRFEDEIKNSNKKLWICGHTHAQFDHMVGECRVFGNPLGYPKELYQTVDDYEIKVIEYE